MPELAEGARLLSEYPANNGIEGSNPSLSAMHPISIEFRVHRSEIDLNAKKFLQTPN